MAYKFADRPTQKDREKHSLYNSFITQYRTTTEGCDVEILEKKYKAIVKEHTNPLNIKIRDIEKRLIVLSDIIKCGDEITIPGNSKPFLAVTSPVFNGVYAECKIKRLDDTIKFELGETHHIYGCSIADELVYEEGSYQNERKVFAEDESVALILKDDDITSKLTLFDYVIINGVSHKIAEIDKTLVGCIQLVAYECFIDEVFKIEDTNTIFKGLGKFARVKDYQLNSMSTKLSVPFKTIKQGDIVYHSYKYPDGMIEEKRYITVSNENQNVNCDEFLLYECMNEMHLCNDAGEVSKVKYFYENNRYRARENDGSNMSVNNSEYELTLPYNEFTKRLNRETNRVLIHIQDGDIEAFNIFGVEKLQRGLIRVSLNSDKIDPNNDLIDHDKKLYIADYYKHNNKTTEDIIGNSHIIIGQEEIYSINEEAIGKWAVDTDIVNVSPDGNKCVVESVDSNKHIGKKFELTYTVGSQIYKKEITIITW